MANNVMPLVYKTKLGNATAKSVLVLLAEASNCDGFSFPAMTYIAECTEVSERQVRRIVQIFREIGLITHYAVSIPNRYRLAFQINMGMLTSDLTGVFREAFEKVQGYTPAVCETEPAVCETEPPHPLIGGTAIEPPLNRNEPPTRAANGAARDLALTPVAPLAGSVLKPEELIYAAYPRREGRLVALKAIEAAVVRLRHGTDGSPPMELREAQKYLWGRATLYADSPAGQRADKTLIPHPATWFNQARYQDDEENWQLPGAGNGGNLHGNSANKAQQRSDSNFAALERFALRRGINLRGADSSGGSASGLERSERSEPGDLFSGIIQSLSPG